MGSNSRRTHTNHKAGNGRVFVMRGETATVSRNGARGVWRFHGPMGVGHKKHGDDKNIRIWPRNAEGGARSAGDNYWAINGRAGN